jgi:hypothetical protein
MRNSVFVRTKWVACLLLLCGVVSPAVAQTKPLSPGTAKTSWAQLPPAAQVRISEAIGRDQAPYHALAIPKGFRLKDPRSGLQAEFTRQGVSVKSGTEASWSFKLDAYGGGNKLRAVSAARPRASGNRVEYRRGALVEWYVNGPSGLEQGFTLAKAPPQGGSGTVSLALALSGDLATAVDASNTGLTLSGSDGQPLLHYTGLAASDATGRALRSWLELSGRRLLLHVDAAGARYPIIVDPYFQVAKLTAYDGAANNSLGSWVGISGDGSTIVAADSVHALYVFLKPASGWSSTSNFAAKLTLPEGSFSSWNISVSGDGSTVVAGESGHWSTLIVDDQPPVITCDHYGVVHVFAKPSTGWANGPEIAELSASDTSSSFCGLSGSVAVSADGLTVAAGAANKDVFGDTPDQGAVYVFIRQGEIGWFFGQTEVAQLTALTGEAHDLLGFSVGVSGDGSTIVAGAPVTGFGTKTAVGGVYVFERPSGGWSTETETGFLGASDGTTEDTLGDSLGISADGSTVAAAAPDKDAASLHNSGEVYIFVKPSEGCGTDPPESAGLTASDPVFKMRLGAAMSFSGDGSTVVASSGGGDPDQVPPLSAYVFVRPSTGWSGDLTETAKITTTDFQRSISVSGNGSTVAIGAPFAVIGTNQGQGAVYVFSNFTRPFGTISISGLQFTQGSTSTTSNFDLKVSFTLDALSSGINPITEPVRVQIGSLFLTIPPGSFHKNSQGNYVFRGPIGGVSLDAQFKVLKANSYQFLLDGKNAQFQSTTGPLSVVLSIGDDGGSATK